MGGHPHRGHRRAARLAGSLALLLACACTAEVTGPPPSAAPTSGPAPSAQPEPAVRPEPTTQPEPATQPPFPIRAAFVYPWFPEGWEQQALRPFSRFRPTLGFYDSGDRATIEAQVRALSYGRFQAAIVSWWGPGEKNERDRIPALLRTAAQVEPGMRFALYYEAEGGADPPVEALVRDLGYVRARYASAANYLRVDGRPVIFVYSSDDRDCATADRWSAATARSDFYVVMKVFPDWSECLEQPDGWHEYAPATPIVSYLPETNATTGSVSVSPGFWLAGEGAPALGRDLRRWRDDVAAMAASEAEWHLVTSFNEWGEGTAVEGAVEWASPSGQGAYLDVLHRFGE
jgi:hypothetical protein